MCPRFLFYLKTNHTRLQLGCITLTLNLLTCRIWWAPNNASRWQMGFNSAFKGLKMKGLFHTAGMRADILSRYLPNSHSTEMSGLACFQTNTLNNICRNAPVQNVSISENKLYGNLTWLKPLCWIHSPNMTYAVFDIRFDFYCSCC